MKKLAALIYFKADVSEADARKAIEQISRVLEKPYEWDFDTNQLKETVVGNYVEEYDDSQGSPVWYIP